MPAFLAFIPAAAWRWIAILGVAAAFGGWCWTNGADHIQARWDAHEITLKAQAADLAAAQRKGLDRATDDYAKGVTDDAKLSAAVRAAVARQCAGRVLPSGNRLQPERGDRAPVPAVPRQGAGGAAADQGDGLSADDIAEDESVTCPALYRQAKWLRDLAIAAGAWKD